MNILKYVMGLALAVSLTACGGGGGSAGSVSGGSGGTSSSSGTGGTGGTTTTPTAASFVFTLDKSSISNAGSDKALLTITALDSARNVVSGIPVSVSVDTGIYTPIASTTGTTGQASGNISIGGNKANRDITATINVGGQAGTAVITVTGSQISLTALPSTPSIGATGQLITVKATDANGAAIAGEVVKLQGTLLGSSVLSVTTDGLGNATATYTAPLNGGTYKITADGLGVSATRDVPVGAGTTSDVVGTIPVPSLAIAPNTIAPNVAGATTSRAGIRAVFQNASNQAIQNVRVRFEIVQPGLGSGEQISTGTATLYSDASGVVTADYIAGTRTSPTNGVIIKACYGKADADTLYTAAVGATPATSACTNSTTATLTVAGQPISITLGDNNELAKGGNNLTYIKKFDVAVADAAGNAVANAIVSASVDLTRYGKGLYANPRLWCANEDTNRNGFLDTGEDLNGNGILDAGEDVNGNGVLDGSEDLDGNRALSPRKADVILSFVGTNTTGANGRATIQVEYPQNVATWLDYSVRVTTNVAGSEGTVVKSYITSFVIGDDTNGSFLTPPYGVNNCNTAN